MTINISIQIEPSQQLPVKLLRETAKYLLLLSGASVVQEIETPIDQEPEVPDTVASSIEELDSEGKAWDYKLHSGTKAKNKDGRWKLKRNLDSKFEVVSESGIAEKTEPVLPPEDLLGMFMSKVTEKIVSGKMTHNTLAAFLRENGIPDVPSIQNFPQLLPELIRKIEA